MPRARPPRPARCASPRPEAGEGELTGRAPSSRRSTRSAIAVAPASCVTITTARPSSAPARSRRSTSAPASASRLPVGSSASSSAGSLTSARAIAKRCCSPPESWWASSRRPIAARGARSAPRRARRFGCAPRTRPASSTLASPESSGSRWKNWKTKPMWRRRSAAQRLLAGAGDLLAGDLDRPGVGPVEPAEQVQQRRLPVPERPRMATTSPGATSRSVPSSSRRAARPSPNVLTRPLARTTGIRTSYGLG